MAHGPRCSAACGIFPDQGSNPCPLHWQADSQPLHHQVSPSLSILDAGRVVTGCDHHLALYETGSNDRASLGLTAFSQGEYKGIIRTPPHKAGAPGGPTCSAAARVPILSVSLLLGPHARGISGMLGCLAEGTNVGDIWNGVSQNAGWAEVSALFTLDSLLLPSLCLFFSLPG